MSETSHAAAKSKERSYLKDEQLLSAVPGCGETWTKQKTNYVRNDFLRSCFALSDLPDIKKPAYPMSGYCTVVTDLRPTATTREVSQLHKDALKTYKSVGRSIWTVFYICLAVIYKYSFLQQEMCYRRKGYKRICNPSTLLNHVVFKGSWEQKIHLQDKKIKSFKIRTCVQRAVLQHYKRWTWRFKRPVLNI